MRLLDRRTRALLGASRLGFSVAASATLLLFYNLQFWRDSLQALGGAAAGSVSFLVALGAILITLHALILHTLPGRRTAPVVAAAL
ncbi:MAG TPA: hypothetical protein VLD59_07730, partial [Steroidobacteraceae bacterium]|nr:hypothetical protein [Steroidobacteraceae bacterium]